MKICCFICRDGHGRCRAGQFDANVHLPARESFDKLSPFMWRLHFVRDNEEEPVAINRDHANQEAMSKRAVIKNLGASKVSWF